MLRESGTPLDVLVDGLGDFAEHAPGRILGALRRTGDGLLLEGFDRSRAPSGAAWAPLKRRPKNRPGRRPLVDAGQLRRWASHGVLIEQRAIWSLPGYGAVHHHGRRDGTIPARPILPPGVLPAHWHARLSYEAERAAIPRLPT